MPGTKVRKARSAGRAGAGTDFRVRVRMYRQGLGDCFLLTFPRDRDRPFQMLIDCGALARTDAFMTGVVEHIRDTIRADGKSRLDLVVATHEHKDHLSGFNQAREVFDKDIEIGGVWLGWTENLTNAQIRKIKESRRETARKLAQALDAPALSGVAELESTKAMLEFSRTSATGLTIAEALEYLKSRGRASKNLRFLEPGDGPIALEGVGDVRVFVLGPPRDPVLLKGSEVTKRAKDDGYVYHLTRQGAGGIDTVLAAAGVCDAAAAYGHPFALEHEVTRSSPYFANMRSFAEGSYDDPRQAWRRIDHDWTIGLEQLALDLDSDTNNTSLVLAFEFVSSGEVLLFVGDAQVGNWQSWAGVEFGVPGKERPVRAHDLLARTVFYKVGHHCSHNATLRKHGLELMTRDDLVAFIPLDKATAKKQHWDMPAGPLFKALTASTGGRVVISDRALQMPKAAGDAGIVSTDDYIEFCLR